MIATNINFIFFSTYLLNVYFFKQIEERLADMDGEDINLEDDEDDSIMGRNFEHRGAHLQPAQNYHQDLPDQVFMIFLKKKEDMYTFSEKMP